MACSSVCCGKVAIQSLTNCLTETFSNLAMRTMMMLLYAQRTISPSLSVRATSMTRWLLLPFQ